ncbi:MAG TPA: alanine dehydrogenase, partial [Thermoanaerobaculia bacterium]
MRIGVPTEIKNNEYRVGMTPAGARDLSSDGHEVFVQQGAGNGSGFGDAEYEAAGAKILPDADAVYEAADMIVKVKEP